MHRLTAPALFAATALPAAAHPGHGEPGIAHWFALDHLAMLAAGVATVAAAVVLRRRARRGRDE